MREATGSLGCCSLTAREFVSSTVLLRAGDGETGVPSTDKDILRPPCCSSAAFRPSLSVSLFPPSFLLLFSFLWLLSSDSLAAPLSPKRGMPLGKRAVSPARGGDRRKRVFCADRRIFRQCSVSLTFVLAFLLFSPRLTHFPDLSPPRRTDSFFLFPPAFFFISTTQVDVIAGGYTSEHPAFFFRIVSAPSSSIFFLILGLSCPARTFIPFVSLVRFSLSSFYLFPPFLLFFSPRNKGHPFFH